MKILASPTSSKTVMGYGVLYYDQIRPLIVENSCQKSAVNLSENGKLESADLGSRPVVHPLFF